ncbi:hypothetical protein GC170_20485 [bacterium]|nr:hypothetical protein [bacterium]
MNRRKTGLLAIALFVTAGVADTPLSLSRIVFGALQNTISATAVYFKSTDTKFRKIAVRFNVSGTGHRFIVGDATSGMVTYSAGTPTIVEDSGASTTYVSVVYNPKSIPAGDAPARSGTLSDITFTITIDGNKSDLPVKAPVIDVDPCATK